MALNVKNYFFDVLPLDLQEHILNIKNEEERKDEEERKKKILSRCFNYLFNNRIDEKEKRAYINLRERNINNNHRSYNATTGDFEEWERSREWQGVKFAYMEKKMKRIKKYKNKLEEIEKKFRYKEDEKYRTFKELEEIIKEEIKEKRNLIYDYMINFYITIDYDDEALNFNDFTFFIHDLEIDNIYY
jgi:hypothetical protein